MTKCCASRRSPEEAMFRDGNFDRWDVDQAFSVGWRMHHAHALSKNGENLVVRKSADVFPHVQYGTRSPQWCGARWRRQDILSINASSIVVRLSLP